MIHGMYNTTRTKLSIKRGRFFGRIKVKLECRHILTGLKTDIIFYSLASKRSIDSISSRVSENNPSAKGDSISILGSVTINVVDTFYGKPFGVLRINPCKKINLLGLNDITVLDFEDHKPVKDSEGFLFRLMLNNKNCAGKLEDLIIEG